jgi:hypothetical protein
MHSDVDQSLTEQIVSAVNIRNDVGQGQAAAVLPDYLELIWINRINDVQAFIKGTLNAAAGILRSSPF